MPILIRQENYFHGEPHQITQYNLNKEELKKFKEIFFPDFIEESEESFSRLLVGITLETSTK